MNNLDEPLVYIVHRLCKGLLVDTPGLQKRVNELESAINEVLSQELDDICWMDAYTMLGKLVGKQFNPLLLPRENFKGNCERFTAHVYEGVKYDRDAVTTMCREHHEAKNLLRNAGYGVTGTPLIETVKEALADVRFMQETLNTASQE